MTPTGLRALPVLLCLTSPWLIGVGCKPAGKLSSSSIRQESGRTAEPGQGPLGPPELPPLPPQDSPSQSVPQYKKVSCGEASYYGPGFEGDLTANGEVFDKRKLTAAHRTLPFGTVVRVVPDGRGLMPTDPVAGVDVVINDNGPFAPGRIIDLSEAAFARLAPLGQGTLRVCLFSRQ